MSPSRLPGLIARIPRHIASKHTLREPGRPCIDGCADHEHSARVAVVAVLDDRDVDVDDVAVAQRAVARNSVAHDVVDGGADRLREWRRAGRAAVVQGRRDRAQIVDDVVVAEPIELLGGDARLHVRRRSYRALALPNGRPRASCPALQAF